MKAAPVLLVIFDGFGLNPSRAHNAWSLARTPHLDHYFSCWPHSVLQASGRAVGLPDGQFGNSEVGHLTLGSGRVLEQDLMRIVNAIYDGALVSNPAWTDLMRDARRLHLVGMVSDGGVHSHIGHLLGLLDLLHGSGIEPVLHMITDGRDTAPRAALHFLERIEEKLSKLDSGSIATVCGRYCAMDRARHWDRTRRAWNCLVRAEGITADTPRGAIESAYARGEGDEFIQPTVIDGYQGMSPEDPVLLFNFRSDRIRQLSAALGLPEFDAFERYGTVMQRLVCMTEYDASYPFPVLLPPQTPQRVLSELISEAGLRQLHCAETEKYPHVTYFFNGGREQPFAGEDRIIVPSPTVATYDMQPEMNAAQVASELIGAIERDAYDFIVTNFANTDMVGHTARREAVIRAVETIDNESHRVFRVALERGWRILLTADHGNCDEMVNPDTGEPHTRHSEYPVPLLIMGAGAVRLGTGRGLADIAPTILDLLGLPRPPEMTGRSLILKDGLL